MMTNPPMSLSISMPTFVRSSHKAEAGKAPLRTRGRMDDIAPASPFHPCCLKNRGDRHYAAGSRLKTSWIIATRQTPGASYTPHVAPSVIFRIARRSIVSSATDYRTLSCNIRATAETLRCSGSSASSPRRGGRAAAFFLASRFVFDLCVGQRNVPTVSGPQVSIIGVDPDSEGNSRFPIKVPQ